MTRADTTPTCFEVGCGVYPAYRIVSVLMPLHRHLMDKIVLAAHHTAPYTVCLSRDCNAIASAPALTVLPLDGPARLP